MVTNKHYLKLNRIYNFIPKFYIFLEFTEFDLHDNLCDFGIVTTIQWIKKMEFRETGTCLRFHIQ